MILCLIDGDGCIFSSELLAQGRAGGRQAAQVLTKGITDYMAGQGRAQILATVYMNKVGQYVSLTFTHRHSQCFCRIGRYVEQPLDVYPSTVRVLSQRLQSGNSPFPDLSRHLLNKVLLGFPTLPHCRCR